eukprot:507731_1
MTLEHKDIIKQEELLSDISRTNNQTQINKNAVKSEQNTDSNNIIPNTNDNEEEVIGNNDGHYNNKYKWICYHCNKKLKSQNSFKNHNWSEHEDSKPIRCPYCNASYK